MKDNRYERCVKVGKYMVCKKATVRKAAKHFQVSKTTVHNDVTKILPKVDLELALKVRKVLDINKAQRHIRGGLATRRNRQEN